LHDKQDFPSQMNRDFNFKGDPMKNRIINLSAFAILTVLWLAFLAVMLFNRELLDTIWHAFRAWPLILQILVGLLVLPVAVGLWIWETSWPMVLRLVLVLGLAWATIYVFFPRKPHSQPESSQLKS
jgi:hypothetical protein